MPLCGCRQRASTSAPASCFRRRSIFGWYQNSIHPFLSASLSSTRDACGAGVKDARLVVDDQAARHGRNAASRAGGLCGLVAGSGWVPALQAFGHAIGPRLQIRNVAKTLRRTG